METARRGAPPVIPLRKTPDVVKGKDKPPYCEHGESTITLRAKS
jgi:hypothetical protein